MSRRGRKELGVANGTRIRVSAAAQLGAKRWRLALACGHVLNVSASDQPKYARCSQGCIMKPFAPAEASP